MAEQQQSTIYPLAMKAGIQRDGTKFATRNYIDGVWMRFQRGSPKKIGGFSDLRYFPPDTLGVPRGTIIVPYNGIYYQYFGDTQGIYCVVFNENFQAQDYFTNITPDGFVPSLNINWTFEALYTTNSRSVTIIAHAGYDLFNLNERAVSPIYYGQVAEDVPFVATGQEVSGGMVVLPPYLITLDNDGTIRISSPNNPTDFPSSPAAARITSQKLIAGRETRGGQQAPAGLIWSLDTLMRLSYVGDPIIFRADKVGKCSLMSKNAIAELDNLFFWAGTDRFMYYNGTINYLPNTQSTNFFFDNLNYEFREKVWATVVPHYNEIWFFFPMGDSTECNAAVIFNKAESAWYDTALPTNRTCGYFDYSLNYPVWLSGVYDVTEEFPSIKVNIWVHERGYDAVTYTNAYTAVTTAIPWAIETGNIAWCAIDAAGRWSGVERLVNIYRFEPDFIQSGNIYLTAKGKSYANAAVQSSDTFTIMPAIGAALATQKVDIHFQQREMTLRFEGNDIGSYVEFGNCLIHIDFGDVRP